MLNKKEPEVFTYEEAAAYIEEIPKFTKKHTLEHTKLFLKRLGNPAVDRKIVHVAGTNGKGSYNRKEEYNEYKYSSRKDHS